MKGVILSLNPAARIVDVTHSVPPQNVARGAWTWEEVAPWFPRGTIHVGVVDPGVGTARKAICAVVEGSYFLAPDNGLLDRLARRTRPTTIVELSNREFRQPHVSNTFHGRDIFAPAAAHLSLGVDAARLGSPVERIVELHWPEVVVMPGRIQGTVRSIDSFGNLVTDIEADKLADVPTEPDRVRVKCDEHETQGLFKTYGEQPPMTLLALVGSSGYLELAIVQENAALMLGIRTGTPVTVEWS